MGRSMLSTLQTAHVTLWDACRLCQFGLRHVQLTPPSPDLMTDFSSVRINPSSRIRVVGSVDTRNCLGILREEKFQECLPRLFLSISWGSCERAYEFRNRYP